MSSMFAPILGEIDTRVLIGFAVILLLCAILAFVKKAIKIGVIVGIICVLSVYLVPVVQSFQEKYKFSVQDGIASISIDGREYTLDRSTIESIKLENGGFTGYKIEVAEEDGTLYADIPTFMVDGIRDFADKYNISIEVLE